MLVNDNLYELDPELSKIEQAGLFLCVIGHKLDYVLRLALCVLMLFACIDFVGIEFFMLPTLKIWLAIGGLVTIWAGMIFFVNWMHVNYYDYFEHDFDDII